MPITIPTLDNRRYQALLDDSLARISVHNPQWTNFNDSDPGVTLIQVYTFLTENLLYRTNQIPERNRRKFLSLLGLPLQAASPARGLVTFSNERGPLQTLTLTKDVEVRAGQVPFRTEAGLDVLPIEAQVYYKHELTGDAADAVRGYYAQLYASWLGAPPTDPATLRMYETRQLAAPLAGGLDLSLDTMDSSLWVALLVRTGDKPYAQTIQTVRAEIGDKVLNLGLAPFYDQPQQALLPGPLGGAAGSTLSYQMPKIPASGGLPSNAADRTPQYRTLITDPLPLEPRIIQVPLPPADQLTLWNNFDPLESGVGDFPPNLADTTVSDRLITWLRIVAPASARLKILWTCINAVSINQRAHVANEALPDANGEPDQTAVLANKPVVPGTIQLAVTPPASAEEPWCEIPDLVQAGPEVPTQDPRQPPSLPPVLNLAVNVFSLDPEAGVLTFGDGTHGRRPPRGAKLRASYDYGVGREGNVAADAINTAPALPAGLKVTNPVRTWGGAEAEAVAEGEKQISLYLQHRDRLVSAADFATVAKRTPGVDLGRVEVLPIFNPRLSVSRGADAPGAVTLMLVPKYDSAHPDTPEPDQAFLKTVGDYLDPRRLVTTEVYLCGPSYTDIWISVGFTAAAGAAIATVREAIKAALHHFLSALPNSDSASPEHGWPLLKPVIDRELLAAVASRVRDVQMISDVLVAEGASAASGRIEMTGLQLPRIAGLAITPGSPIPLDELRGQAPPAGPTSVTFKPVPVIPDECA